MFEDWKRVKKNAKRCASQRTNVAIPENVRDSQTKRIRDTRDPVRAGSAQLLPQIFARRRQRATILPVLSRANS